MPAFQPLSDQQLDQLLGPIALYPDPLLAQILPAATLPTQIVLADRYLASGGDPSQIDAQPWDASVQAVARYPAVLQYLDDNLGWTTELGLAFVNQPQQVMQAVQRLRVSAMNFGNLQSTPQEQVVYQDGEVEILPTQPDVIYLPIYQPDYVYGQSGYPLTFGVACTFGPWLNCDFDWSGHRLFFWGRNHPRPANWWHERSNQRAAWLASQGTVWRPEDHHNIAATRQGDRGWGNAALGSPQPPRPIAPRSIAPRPTDLGSRPAANPRPVGNPGREGGREVGVVHAPSTPAPVVHVGSQGAFGGGESSRDARSFSNRGQESMQAVTRSEPARSEPAHSEPAHVAPAHVEPAHSEPPASHSAPASGGGSGGGRR